MKSGCSPLRANESHPPFCSFHSQHTFPPSLPTASGWPTARRSPATKKCTSCLSPSRAGSGKSPRAEGAIRAVKPLFETRVYRSSLGGYDVAADGQRFIICYEPGQPNAAITLVENWDAELKKK